jgi:nucleoside-diphosphate kinase
MDKEKTMTGMETTLAIIKPNATQSRVIGEIIQSMEQNDFTIRGMKMVRITAEQARTFYDVHEGKPFFNDLVEFMTSGQSVVVALSGVDAINRWRVLMGATDPARAEKGTLRNRYGTSVTQNATHGSDAEETARREVSFFFAEAELYPL